MSIDVNDMIKVLNDNDIKLTGVFHIGAHECEEIETYKIMGITNLNDIIWIDAIPKKVEEANNRNIPNVYNHVVTDKDDQYISFNISNNYQSSSVLELSSHLKIHHPTIHYIDKIEAKTITIDSFFKQYDINCSKYNFWNFDIQGAELLALKGGVDSIKHVKAIYLEVNEKELYINCALIGDIDKFLENLGFKRVLTSIHHSCGWGDALYIRV
jgi:FkbM family methyltransferase